MGDDLAERDEKETGEFRSKQQGQWEVKGDNLRRVLGGRRIEELVGPVGGKKGKKIG